MHDKYYNLIWLSVVLFVLALYIPWQSLSKVRVLQLFNATLLWKGFFENLRPVLKFKWDWRISAAGTVSCIALIAHYFGHIEYQQYQPATFVYSLAVTFCVFSFLALLSKRLLFSAFLTVAIIGLIHAISTLKYKYMYVSLHAYDLFFYTISLSTFDFLWSDYPLQITLTLLAVIGLSLVCFFLWRREKFKISRAFSVIALLAGMSIA